MPPEDVLQWPQQSRVNRAAIRREMTQHLLIKIGGMTERPSAHLFPVFAAECDRSVKPTVSLLNPVFADPALIIRQYPRRLAEITIAQSVSVVDGVQRQE